MKWAFFELFSRKSAFLSPPQDGEFVGYTAEGGSTSSLGTPERSEGWIEVLMSIINVVTGVPNALNEKRGLICPLLPKVNLCLFQQT